MKKYDIIYADPAWSFNNKRTGGGMTSGASQHYDTLSVNQMSELKVKDIASENCVLFMWWVASQPKEAIDLVESWGFKIKTMTAFNWVKTTRTGKLYFGMGFWTRAGSEMCLIAVKGKPKRISGGVRSVNLSENTKHSRKPEIFREQIIKLMGDIPRIVLFAREKHEGWDVWGNEVESDIEL